ncbi:hypothetical protein [Bacillus litorisediminis]|nr:hypothetical protein [Bacillus litorisediminis]
MIVYQVNNKFFIDGTTNLVEVSSYTFNQWIEEGQDLEVVEGENYD